MDQLITGLLNGEMRIIAISGKEMVQGAQDIHNLSRVATAALGRQILMTAMMTALQKNESDTLTTILAGDGVGGNLVCVGRPGGLVKACAAFPEAELPLKANGKLDVGGYVGSQGKLTVARATGAKEPYVGTCPLVSGEVAEDFAQYFTVSEQTPSLVYLGVQLRADSRRVLAGAGLFLQPLPDCAGETVDAVMGRAAAIQSLGAGLADGMDLKAVLADIFLGLEIEWLTEILPALRCDCSRDRLARVVVSLGKEELLDMMETDGQAELTCRFCGSKYLFTKEALAELLREALEHKNEC
ncbi:MAG: Hsp33 family molecular chaperone HslO [Clostridiales bacterium]|nr:Hsp33 family molecular chaperone HslO [Clostridiales bacterium]